MKIIQPWNLQDSIAFTEPLKWNIQFQESRTKIDFRFQNIRLPLSDPSLWRSSLYHYKGWLQSKVEEASSRESSFQSLGRNREKICRNLCERRKTWNLIRPKEASQQGYQILKSKNGLMLTNVLICPTLNEDLIPQNGQ